jgi:hypothetical protein
MSNEALKPPPQPERGWFHATPGGEQIDNYSGLEVDKWQQAQPGIFEGEG